MKAWYYFVGIIVAFVCVAFPPALIGVAITLLALALADWLPKRELRKARKQYAADLERWQAEQIARQWLS